MLEVFSFRLGASICSHLLATQIVIWLKRVRVLVTFGLLN